MLTDIQKSGNNNPFLFISGLGDFLVILSDLPLKGVFVTDISSDLPLKGSVRN